MKLPAVILDLALTNAFAAAQAFEKKTGTKIEVTAGPTPQWKDQAKADADLILLSREGSAIFRRWGWKA